VVSPRFVRFTGQSSSFSCLSEADHIRAPTLAVSWVPSEAIETCRGKSMLRLVLPLTTVTPQSTCERNQVGDAGCE
jgi:hypothetical protein